MKSEYIVLSPEISELVDDVEGLQNVPFETEEINLRKEELLNKILNLLPLGVIGFEYNGKVYLTPSILENIPNLLKGFQRTPQIDDSK